MKRGDIGVWYSMTNFLPDHSRWDLLGGFQLAGICIPGGAKLTPKCRRPIRGLWHPSVRRQGDLDEQQSTTGESVAKNPIWAILADC